MLLLGTFEWPLNSLLLNDWHGYMSRVQHTYPNKAPMERSI